MTIDRAVFLFAGLVILASLALGRYVSAWWLLLAAAAALNMIQAAFTGVCPAAMALKRLGLRPGPAFH